MFGCSLLLSQGGGQGSGGVTLSRSHGRGDKQKAVNCFFIIVHSAKLEIAPLDTYYNRRLLRWAGHVSCMPISRVPRKLLATWVAKPRPVGSPQMTWGRALNKALRAAGVPSTFTKWRDLAANRGQWWVLCGAKARGTVHTPPKHPRDI